MRCFVVMVKKKTTQCFRHKANEFECKNEIVHKRSKIVTTPGSYFLNLDIIGISSIAYGDVA